jgi:hypothetical protein
MVAHMKTTIELPKSLLAEAKACAAREGTTLRALIEAGLRSALKERKQKKKPFKLRDARAGSGGMLPGWDMNDFGKIRDASYGDRGGDFEK